MGFTEAERIAFRAQYNEEPSGCWSWKTGSRGLFNFCGRWISAKRVAWEMMGRLLKETHILMRRCENTRCIAPDHHVLAPGHGHTETREETIARFMDNVVFGDGDNCCWLWRAAIERGGYSKFSVCGDNDHAHRWSLRLFKEIVFTPGQQANHNCGDNHARDDKRCVNPDHLYVGTHQQNLRDSFASGIRRQHNERIDTQLARVIIACATGRPGVQRRLGELLGIGPTSINDIVKGRTKPELADVPRGTLDIPGLEKTRPRGNAHHKVRISDETVQWAKQLRLEGVSVVEIAEMLNEPHATVAQLVSGTSRPHLPTPDYGRIKAARAKFTKAQIHEIKIRVDAGESYGSIAGSLGVNEETIGRIWRGDTYGGVL